MSVDREDRDLSDLGVTVMDDAPRTPVEWRQARRRLLAEMGAEALMPAQRPATEQQRLSAMSGAGWRPSPQARRLRVDCPRCFAGDGKWCKRPGRLDGVSNFLHEERRAE